MRISLELKALALGLMVSLSALGLSFGAGALLRRASVSPGQTQSAASGSLEHTVSEAGSVGAIQQGHTLFLKNCAHCHADDATGDEGPNLHGLKRSDDWIARRVRNGVKGEMTAFGEKFSQQDINDLITYLRTLK